MTATACPFEIGSESPTSVPFASVAVAPKRTVPYFVVGSLIFLLGSAPPADTNPAPTAARPAFGFIEASTDDPDVRPLPAVERSVARLKQFRSYPANWDDRDAEAPNPKAIDEAISYLSRLEPWHPAPLATMNTDGLPVLEFEDVGTNTFSSITFLGHGNVELYSKPLHQLQSRFLPTILGSAEADSFLLDVMGLPT